MRRYEAHTVTLRGGPRDGAQITLPWSTVRQGRFVVPFRPPTVRLLPDRTPAMREAVYVPCPTEPDSVWRLDARASGAGTPLEGSETCHVFPADPGEASVRGISIPSVRIDDVYEALDAHYAAFGHAPKRFAFGEGAALIIDPENLY